MLATHHRKSHTVMLFIWCMAIQVRKYFITDMIMPRCFGEINIFRFQKCNFNFPCFLLWTILIAILYTGSILISIQLYSVTGAWEWRAKKYINTCKTIMQNYVKQHNFAIGHLGLYDYDDVIISAMARQIISLTIVYSTLIQAKIKEKIIALRHWPLCGEFFHLMTSSWLIPICGTLTRREKYWKAPRIDLWIPTYAMSCEIFPWNVSTHENDSSLYTYGRLSDLQSQCKDRLSTYGIPIVIGMSWDRLIFIMRNL